MKADLSAEGVIFNIQKYSVNDGPGIRTVVFFKGCPLRCAWCSNPESQSIRVQVLWEKAKCLRCGHCETVCPEGAIRCREGRVRVDAHRCAGCGTCVRECPARALRTEGEKKTAGEILETVMQDLPFYEESGGGITLSGGELLLQPELALNLLTGAKEKGLGTCCETTGMADPDLFERVTGPADLILFDVKHWDSEAHRRGTGLGSALPTENLRRAIRRGKEVLPRIPVIPGFNDSQNDASALAMHLRSLGAGRCQLLPFHQFGENKYDLLGADYAYRDVPALHSEDLEGYREIMVKSGVDAFF